jgi:acetyl-CoA carboxylase carboxyl transferase subunit alpha
MAENAMERDFEKPIIELEKRIEELESFSRKAGVDLSGEIAKLRERANQEKKDIFARLNAWQRVLLSRDPARPDVMDYLNLVFEDFVELHGDRAVGDDRALITGLCRVGGIRIMLVAQRKGKTTKERMAYNFGSPNPEGYRKAIEKMKLAEKFHIPVVTLVNTPGAFPGLAAEQHGPSSSPRTSRKCPSCAPPSSPSSSAKAARAALWASAWPTAWRSSRTPICP